MRLAGVMSRRRRPLIWRHVANEIPFPGQENGFDREVVTITVAAVPGLAMPNPTTLSTRRFPLSAWVWGECTPHVGAAVIFIGIFVRCAVTLAGSSPLLVCWGEGGLFVRCEVIREEVGLGGVGLREQVCGWEGCRGFLPPRIPS